MVPLNFFCLYGPAINYTDFYSNYSITFFFSMPFSLSAPLSKSFFKIDAFIDF